MDTLVLRNINNEVFFDSTKHITGDTRIKNRCKLYIWQYRDRDDYDGSRCGACIGMDVEELAFLRKHGVKFYQCNFVGGTIYKISLDDIQKWAHPVVGNREGDREQICVSIRHWQEEGAPPKPKREKKQKPTKVLPLSTASSLLQGKLF